MDKLLDHITIEMPGAEILGAEHAVQYALHGQSEDVSDLQSEGGSPHSIEKNNIPDSTPRLVHRVISILSLT
eukprot:6789114-Pyramimonas_sp.AAC.1